MSVHLRVMSKRGTIQDLEVERILAIDGEPYAGSQSDWKDVLLHLDSRLSAIERILGLISEVKDHGG